MFSWFLQFLKITVEASLLFGLENHKAHEGKEKPVILFFSIISRNCWVLLQYSQSSRLHKLRATRNNSYWVLNLLLVVRETVLMNPHLNHQENGTLWEKIWALEGFTDRLTLWPRSNMWSTSRYSPKRT